MQIFKACFYVDSLGFINQIAILLLDTASGRIFPPKVDDNIIYFIWKEMKRIHNPEDPVNPVRIFKKKLLSENSAGSSEQSERARDKKQSVLVRLPSLIPKDHLTGVQSMPSKLYLPRMCSCTASKTVSTEIEVVARKSKSLL